MQLHKAERKRSKLRGWLSGVSSSGKTFTALTLFKGFGGKTALIDTEKGRGELHSDEFEYDVLTLDAPYTPERYIEAIKVVEAAGYDNLIIDSVSHAWMEILEIKGKLDERGGNSFTNWNAPGRRYASLMEYINQSKLHVISTARAKRKHVMETDDKGKTKVTRIGLDDVAREGAEYDLTVEFRLNADHTAEALKDNIRTNHVPMFLGKDPRVLTEADGVAIRDWLNSGKEEKPKCVRCKLAEVATKREHYDLCNGCAEVYDAKKEDNKE